MITINQVMTITDRGTARRFYIEGLGDGRLHILNEKSLRWHLKHKFCMTGVEAKSVLERINTEGFCVLAKVAA